MYSLGQQSEQLVSCYDILRVKPDATEDEIKSAYHRLAKRFHPDRVPVSETHNRRMAELRLRLINEAYANLKTREKRERYNRIMRHRIRQHRKKLLTAQNDNERKGFFGALAGLFRSKPGTERR